MTKLLVCILAGLLLTAKGLGELQLFSRNAVRTIPFGTRKSNAGDLIVGCWFVVLGAGVTLVSLILLLKGK